MATKSNIRSIRFSDELADLIDRQVGNSFTAKFENLVTRCVWELPQKEKELKRLGQEIQRKREQLNDMSQQLSTLNRTIFTLEKSIRDLDQKVKQSIQEWDM